MKFIRKILVNGGGEPGRFLSCVGHCRFMGNFLPCQNDHDGRCTRPKTFPANVVKAAAMYGVQTLRYEINCSEQISDGEGCVC